MTIPREVYKHQDVEVREHFERRYPQDYEDKYAQHTGVNWDGTVHSENLHRLYLTGLVRRRFGFRLQGSGVGANGVPYYDSNSSLPQLTRSTQDGTLPNDPRQLLDLIIMISIEKEEKNYSDLIENYLKPILERWNDAHGAKKRNDDEDTLEVNRKEVQAYVNNWIRSADSTKEMYEACKVYVNKLGNNFQNYPVRSGHWNDFKGMSSAFFGDDSAGRPVQPIVLFTDMAKNQSRTIELRDGRGKSGATPPEVFGFAQKLKDSDFLSGFAGLSNDEQTTAAVAEALAQSGDTEEGRRLREALSKLKDNLGIEGRRAEPVDENDILNIRQCFLMSQSKFKLDSGGYAPEWEKSTVDPSDYFQGRIFRTSEDKFLFNKLLANPPKQGQWFSDFREKRKVMNKKLFWVYTDANGDLKQTELFLTKDKMAEDFWNQQSKFDGDFWDDEGSFLYENHGLNDANLNIRKGHYYLKSMNINYDGTNPSTARKDVVVEMEFSISSLATLELPISNKIAEIDDFIKLYDLVTLPVTDKISNSDNVGKMGISSYDPDYSRVRLVVYEDTDDRTAMIIDLSTIDHEIQRSSDTGACTFKITYRGYFEQVLTMPFTDVLATKEKRDKRREIDSQLDVIRNSGRCSVEAIRESKQIEAQWYRENTAKIKATRFITELWNRGLIYDYALDEKKAASVINSSFNTVQEIGDPLLSFQNVQPGKQAYYASILAEQEEVDINDENYLKNYRNSQNIAGQREKNWWDSTLDFFGVEAAEQGTQVLRGSCFFLGDLFNAALDVLYDDEETRKKLQLQFIFGSIAEESDGTLFQYASSNPLNYAVDVAVFMKWFEERVVAKKISFYPVTTFFRDILQKLLVDLKMKYCMNSEIEPPQYRMAFVTTDETRSINLTSDGFLNLDQPFDQQIFDRPILTRAPFKPISETKNYCVFYQQSQSRFETTKYNDLIHTPRIFYGMKNNRWNYVSNVSFAKTDAPFLREARYFNNNFGDLSLLSNVYDLSFSFNSRMSNKVFYPGVIFEFILLDWGPEWTDSPPIEAVPITTNADGTTTAAPYTVFGQANPHKLKTVSNITGFGGYFIVKNVSYTLGETNQDYEININSKFIGANESVLMRNGKRTQNVTEKDKSISDQECLAELRRITKIKEKKENN